MEVGAGGWNREPGDDLCDGCINMVALCRELKSGKSDFCLAKLALIYVECYPLVLAALQELSYMLHVGGLVFVIYDNVIYDSAKTCQPLKCFCHSAIMVFCNGRQPIRRSAIFKTAKWRGERDQQLACVIHRALVISFPWI